MLIRAGQAVVLRLEGKEVGALSVDLAATSFAHVSVTKVNGRINIALGDRSVDVTGALVVTKDRQIEIGDDVVTRLSGLTDDENPQSLQFIVIPLPSGPARRIETLDLSDYFDQPDDVFAWGDPATPAFDFAGTLQVGSTLTFVPAEMLNADTVQFIVQRLLSGVWQDFATLASGVTTYVVPAGLAGAQLRPRQVATGATGGGVFAAGVFAAGVFARAAGTFTADGAATPAVALPTGRPPMDAAYLTMTSEGRSGGQFGAAGTWFQPVLTMALPGGRVVGVNGVEAEWSTSALAVPPSNQIEVIVPHPTLSGKFRPVMRDALKIDQVSPNRLDFGPFLATETNRRAQWVWRYRDAGGEWSDWSPRYSVPLPVVAPSWNATILAQPAPADAAFSIDLAAGFDGTPGTYGATATVGGVAVTGITISGSVATFPARAAGAAMIVTATMTNDAGVANGSFTINFGGVAPFGGDGNWAKMIVRPPKFIGAVVDYPLNQNGGFQHGTYWGSGWQLMHSLDREGDVVMTGQDMGGCWRSIDGGRRFAHAGNAGLNGVTGLGLKIDPANTSVVVAAFGAYLYATGAHPGGIYRSTDRGETWALSRRLTRPARNPRCTIDLMCCHPTTGGSPTTRKYTFVEWTEQTTTAYPWTTSVAPLLWISDDGGQTFPTSRALPAALAGVDIYQVVQDPADADHLLLCSQAGLWETTTRGAAGAADWTQIRTGDVRRAWFDPTDSLRILYALNSTADTGGLYETTNGGTTWTQRLRLHQMITFAVGPLVGGRRRIYAAKHRANATGFSTTSPIVHNWQVGVGWPALANVPQTTWEPDTAWCIGTIDAATTETAYGVHHDSVVSQAHTRFLPSPTNALECLTDGYALFWRTDDGGRTWRHAGAGFDGYSVQFFAFDKTDRNRLAMAASDKPFSWSNDGGRSCPGILSYDSTTRKQIEDLCSSDFVTGRALCILPEDSRRPRRVIIGNGGTTGRQTLGVWNPGDAQLTSYHARPAAEGGGARNLTFASIHWQDPDTAFIGALKTIDGGDNFTVLGRTVCGVSRQDSERIYGWDATGFWLSTDGGATWGDSAWRATTAITDPSSEAVFALSPHDDTMALTRNGGSSTVSGFNVARQDAVLVRGAPGSVTTLNLGVPAFAAWPSEVHAGIDSVAWDAFDPTVCYVGYYSAYGYACLFRVRFAANFLSVADRTNLTGNLPKARARAALAVNHLTGDVFFGSGAGIFVHQPYGGIRSNSLLPNMAVWFKNAA